MEVVLMKDGFFRDTVHELDKTPFGEALDRVVLNATIKTIYETPYLKEDAQTIKYDLENGNLDMLEWDIKAALATVAMRPDKKTFFNSLLENIKQEQLELYKSIADTIAKEVSLPDGESFLSLSKVEQVHALRQISNIHVNYKGFEFELTPSQAKEIMDLQKSYLKIDWDIKGFPNHVTINNVYELLNYANNEKEVLPS